MLMRTMGNTLSASGQNILETAMELNVRVQKVMLGINPCFSETQ